MVSRETLDINELLTCHSLAQKGKKRQQSNMAPSLKREWRALPLVSRSASADASDNALRIEPEALTILQEVCARNIHVLGLFGPTKTGKRLFLKTLLSSKCDFAADDAASPGSHVLLWLWTPVDGLHPGAAGGEAESVKVVISSGTQVDDTATDRKQRLALLLLLSSALVYNGDGEINAQAIERLDWLADIAQILRIKANQDEASVGAFASNKRSIPSDCAWPSVC